MPPEDNSQVCLINSNYHQCSQNACREHFWYHSARGHGSEGQYSIMLPLYSFLMGRVWSWPDDNFAFARRYLKRLGDHRARALA